MAGSPGSISPVNSVYSQPVQATADDNKAEQSTYDPQVFHSNAGQSMFHPSNDEVSEKDWLLKHDQQASYATIDQQTSEQETSHDADKTQMVSDVPKTSQDYRNKPSNNRPKKKKILICLLLILTLVLLILSPVLLATSKASSSTCAPVYIGDAVYITEVVGFLYNKATITIKAPVETEVEVDIFYIDDANSQWEESNHSSQVYVYSFPQGILVQNNTQSYFLSQSEIEFSFQVQVNSSLELAKLAKICQFSNLKEYNALMDADTNRSIAEAEKRGDCMEILKPPNMFKIKAQGYYWYALSIPTLETLQASYTYHLNKRYYNPTMLGDPYCSVDESDCVIGGLIGQRSTRHLLVYIPDPVGIIEPTDPFTFCVEMSNAWGIAIIVFIPVLLIALFCHCSVRCLLLCF